MLSAWKTFLVTWFIGGSMFAAGSPGPYIDVPFVKQERDGCGAASISMVMQYWQKQLGVGADSDSSAERIQKLLYSHDARGIYASDLARYFEDHGFRAIAFSGTASDLEQHLQKGRPLIVALEPSSGGAPLHYVVVVGIDADRGVVMINDPAERKLLKRNQIDFEGEWKRAHNWTLLAVPQTEGSPSAH